MSEQLPKRENVFWEGQPANKHTGRNFLVVILALVVVGILALDIAPGYGKLIIVSLAITGFVALFAKFR